MGVRNREIHLVVSEEELERIRAKMEELGVSSMSAYMRKMALDGYCVRLELDDVKQMTRLLRYTSNNLNQYVKRAHENGDIYAADIQDLQTCLDEIWEGCKKRYSFGFPAFSDRANAPVLYRRNHFTRHGRASAVPEHSLDILALSCRMRYDKGR